MTLRKATIWLVVSTLIVWIGWDLYAVAEGGLDATESDVIRDASQSFEALAFAGGVVGGHWWISREKPAIRGRARFAVLGLLAASSIALALFTKLPTAIYLFAGLASGHLLWPMESNS